MNNVETPLTPETIAKLGCRPDDRIDKATSPQDSAPGTFTLRTRPLARAPKTMRNNTTAWWDASQIYGYDDTSLKRVKRDPADPAKLLLVPVAGQVGPGISAAVAPAIRSTRSGRAGGGRIRRQLDRSA